MATENTASGLTVTLGLAHWPCWVRSECPVHTAELLGVLSSRALSRKIPASPWC